MERRGIYISQTGSSTTHSSPGSFSLSLLRYFPAHKEMNWRPTGPKATHEQRSEKLTIISFNQERVEGNQGIGMEINWYVHVLLGPRGLDSHPWMRFRRRERSAEREIARHSFQFGRWKKFPNPSVCWETGTWMQCPWLTFCHICCFISAWLTRSPKRICTILQPPSFTNILPFYPTIPPFLLSLVLCTQSNCFVPRNYILRPPPMNIITLLLSSPQQVFLSPRYLL